MDVARFHAERAGGIGMEKYRPQLPREDRVE